MDIFLQTFCWPVAELTAVTSKKWIWFSQISAILNSVLACSLYESSFKPVTFAKGKRNFIFMNTESQNGKRKSIELHM